MTTREQEILNQITREVTDVVGYHDGEIREWKSRELSLDGLAAFLARMEGSKEVEPNCGNSPAGCYCGRCKFIRRHTMSTPSSEEKKCENSDHIVTYTTESGRFCFDDHLPKELPSPTPPDAWEEEFDRELQFYGIHGLPRKAVKDFIRTKKKEWEEQAYYNASMNHQKEHWDCSRTTTLDEVEKVVAAELDAELEPLIPRFGEENTSKEILLFRLKRKLLSRLKEMRTK